MRLTRICQFPHDVQVALHSRQLQGFAITRIGGAPLPPQHTDDNSVPPESRRHQRRAVICIGASRMALPCTGQLMHDSQVARARCQFQSLAVAGVCTGRARPMRQRTHDVGVASQGSSHQHRAVIGAGERRMHMPRVHQPTDHVQISCAGRLT